MLDDLPEFGIELRSPGLQFWEASSFIKVSHLFLDFSVSIYVDIDIDINVDRYIEIYLCGVNTFLPPCGCPRDGMDLR